MRSCLFVLYMYVVWHLLDTFSLFRLFGFIRSYSRRNTLFENIPLHLSVRRGDGIVFDGLLQAIAVRTSAFRSANTRARVLTSSTTTQAGA